MARSIQTYTPFTEPELRNASADIQFLWSSHGATWHVWTSELHRRWPQAFGVKPNIWHNVFGAGVPRPDADPATLERQRLAAIRRHAENAPQDPASLEYWHHLIEGRRLATGVHQRFASSTEAIVASHQDQLEAMEQRDKWRISQESAKAHSLEDPEQQRKALAKVEALDARLAKERGEAMARLKNPAPAVEEEPSEVNQ